MPQPSPQIARIAALCLVMLPGTALAELESEMRAYVVTSDAAGAEQYYEASSVKPGQVIEYRLEHRNTFDNAIGGVAVVGPIPDGSELILGRAFSDVPARMEVRGDFDPDREGEEWSALPARRIVIDSDGTRRVEEAGPEHITAVRWSLSNPMQQGAAVHHGYRVKVR